MQRLKFGKNLKSNWVPRKPCNILFTGMTIPPEHCTDSNLFIYQARGGWPGPSRVSDSPVSAENVIYEAFVLMGENWMVLLFTAFLEER